MLVMRVPLLAVFGLLVLAQETPVFRGGVAVVRLDVQVVDGRHVVGGLTRDDFEVLDNGAPQTIGYFGREAEPLWLVLLLDVSGSMIRYVDEAAKVARQALGQLGPEDRVAVMAFGRETRLVGEFTVDHAEAAHYIKRAREEDALAGGTGVNAAVMEAVEYLREEAEGKPGRRAVVILTDNGGLNYQKPAAAAVDALHSADAVLNALVTPDARPPKPPPVGQYVNPDFAPSDVFLLARESGGEVLKVARGGGSLGEMMERVRTRYSLHYRAPEAAAGERRSVEVRLKEDARRRHRRAEVRARSGYRVPE